MAISENAICGNKILITNCRDYNTDKKCLTRYANSNTEIAIYVDFADVPNNEESKNWYVRFNPSPTATATIIPKASFGYDYDSLRYVFHHQFPLDPNVGSSAFTVNLWSADNTWNIARENLFFYICTGNNRLSNTQTSNSEEVKNNSDENFDFHSLSNQNNFDGYQIYPNPIEQDFTVDYQAIQNEEVTFQILDIEGRSIYTTQIKHPHDGIYSKRIDNLDLTKGLYFCRIQSANSQKIIKVTKL